MTVPRRGAGAVVPHGPAAMVAGLADLLVPPGDADFLRACLLRGPEAGRAWDTWLTRGAFLEDPSTSAGAWAKTFAPLLLNAIERERLAVPPRALIALRAWRLAEAQRAGRYRRVLAHVLSLIDANAIPRVMVNGVPLADVAYADPLFRHCHDIDLIVPGLDAARVAPLLVAAGYRRHRSDTALVVVHPSGLPVWLYDTSSRVPYYRIPLAAVVATATEREIDGVMVRVACRTQMFVHACLQLLGREAGPATARRLVDAWHLTAGDDAIDWGLVLTLARTHGLAGPLAVVCEWLVRHGGAVPPAVAAALASDGLSRQRDVAALVPLLPGGPRSVAALVRVAAPWRTRCAIATAMLCPDARFMAWQAGTQSTPALVAAYVRRLGRPVLGRRTHMQRSPDGQVPAP